MLHAHGPNSRTAARGRYRRPDHLLLASGYGALPAQAVHQTRGASLDSERYENVTVDRRRDWRTRRHQFLRPSTRGTPNRERLTLVPSTVAATRRSSRSARHAGGRGAGSWVVGVGGVDDLGHGVVDDGGQASWPAGSPARRPSPRTRTRRPGRGTRLRR